MAMGSMQARKLPSAVVSSPQEDGVLHNAFNCGNVDWRRHISFTLYLPSSGTGRFAMTLIAQEPSETNTFLERASEVLLGPVLSLVRLLGYSDTFATSFARYQCTFEDSLGDIARLQRAEIVKTLILKPLLNAIRRFGWQ
jgi:hypothetical protein